MSLASADVEVRTLGELISALYGQIDKAEGDNPRAAHALQARRALAEWESRSRELNRVATRACGKQAAEVEE